MRQHPTAFEIPLEVPERVTSVSYVIGPRSFLTDCVEPQTEIRVLYPRRFPSLSSKLSIDGISETGVYGGRADKLRARFSRVVDLPADQPHLDVRPLKIANWSHALNQAFPLALKANDLARENGWGDITVVLPDRVPAQFVRLLDAFGFRHISTNLPVRGRFIRCGPHTGQTIQYHSRRWLAPHMERLRRFTGSVRSDLPRRFFLDRRAGRHLLNADEVRVHLAARGFVPVYAEDFSVEEQIELFLGAEDVVALHGAGLAPVMYRTEEDGPLRLIEILSPGLMLNFFQPLMRDLPVDYRFVMGTPTEEMAVQAYRIDSPKLSFKRKHDMSPFALDLAALQLALRPERIEDLLLTGLPLVNEPD
jgi:hypothetical protein